jgi:3',5'-cyclic AMP phosphodiesterase CpdA
VSRLDLAHITDVHLGPLPQARVRELLGKRALGYLSWHRRRHRAHRIEVLDALASDLDCDLPDHIVVTGDLVNIALPPEFEQAARWLEATATPDRLTLVPGNHDAYAGKSYRAGWSRWHTYMQGDDGALAGQFPFVREISPGIALVGLSSAVPSGVGFATGQLGPAQLEALDGLLAELGARGLCRILLLHHPPLGPLIHRRRGLRDETALRAVVARRGAELILSGHQHVFMVGDMPGPERPVPVLVAPSASLAQGHGETGGYLRLSIEPAGNATRIVLQIRRFDPASGRLEVERTAALGDAGGRIVLQPAEWPAVQATASAARRAAG